MDTQECAASKVCCKCKVEKPIAEFSKRRNGSPVANCKDCVNLYSKERYQVKADEIKKRTNAYAKAHRSLYNEAKQRWRERNPDKVAEYLERPEVKARMPMYSKRYVTKNQENPEYRERRKGYDRQQYLKYPERFIANNHKRRAAQDRATPQWCDMKKITEIYRLARELTKKTGVKYVVDHIYPIKGKYVSGLHVHENLQIITHVENLRKSNKLLDDIVPHSGEIRRSQDKEPDVKRM